MKIIYALGDRKISLQCMEILKTKKFPGPVQFIFPYTNGEYIDQIKKLFPETSCILKDEKLIECDYIWSIHFPYIFKKNIISIPRLGVLNIHPSHLPLNKGVDTNSWAILNNTLAGCTLHWIDEGVDTGDIIEQINVVQDKDDTADTLYKKVYDSEIRLFKNNLEKVYYKELPKIKQTEKGTFHLKKDISKERFIDEKTYDKLRSMATNNFKENCKFVISNQTYYVNVNITKETKTEDFGFVIPSYCSSKMHVESLKKCIESIRKFYPTEKIIVIDDFSPENIDVFRDKNIIIEKSVLKGGGDMIVYYLLLKNKYFKQTVIMQDSMRVLSRIRDIQDDVLFLWHATNHKTQWKEIKEPQSEYNKINNIITHNDLLKHNVGMFLEGDFKTFALENIDKKDSWDVCFCLSSIIKLDFLEKLENETKFVTQYLTQLNTNRQRRTAESLFPIACLYVLGRKVGSYEGLYFNGKNPPKGSSTKNKEGHLNCVVGKTFSKISFNRRRTE